MMHSTMETKNKKESIKLWSIALAIFIWQVAAMIINQRILLASPLSVVNLLWELIQTGDFWVSIGYSFLRIISGFLGGTICAILFAILASKISFIRDLLAPFMVTIRTIPVASFVILALIWFSADNLATLISFLMVLPIIYINVLEGIRNTDKNLLEMAKVFRISKWKQLRYIYLFQVFPYFVSGSKIALGLCWKSGVAAEVIGIPENSIGENLYNAKIFLDTPSLLAWTVVIILTSTLFEKIYLGLLGCFSRFMERS